MTITIGHNHIGDEQLSVLKGLIDRAVSMKEQIDSINSDLSDLYQEAASNGFDKGALKEVIKIFREPEEKRAKRAQKDDALSTYLSALGLA
jgi:uncharacterized protein (UPF0335 family)